MTTTGRYFFDCACDALVRDVRYAAIKDWMPYWGDTDARALWQLHLVIKRAREMGLYPTTAQLEAEARRAA